MKGAGKENLEPVRKTDSAIAGVRLALRFKGFDSVEHSGGGAREAPNGGA
jgi:hypothetical protein